MGYSPEDEQMVDAAFDRLMEHCAKICKTQEDADRIKRAFFLAKEAHAGVRRRSGAPDLRSDDRGGRDRPGRQIGHGGSVARCS